MWDNNDNIRLVPFVLQWEIPVFKEMSCNCLVCAQEIAEICEQDQNLEQAIYYYEKAADLFQSEEVTTSANQCKQKIAQFAAQLEQ